MIYSWLRVSCDIMDMKLFVQSLAISLPSAQEALDIARDKVEKMSWQDQDPAWPGVEEWLSKPPDRQLVRQALKKRKLHLETLKHPLIIEDDSQDEDVCNRSPSQGC